MLGLRVTSSRLGLALVILGLLLAPTPVPDHAQGGGLAEASDDLNLPGWERSPGVTAAAAPPTSPPPEPTAVPSVEPVPVSCAVRDGVGFCPNVPYASYELDGRKRTLLLDLYRPLGTAAGLSPVLVYIHGGGWIEGSKDGCPGMTFAQNGYAMACVDYRLALGPGGCQRELIFPAQIHDVKAAVRWLRAHAGEFRHDPERIGALGDSSGGHLAALLGTSGGVQDLEGSDNPGFSDRVQAVADWYGPVDITQGPVVFQDDPCQTDMDYLNATYGGEETSYFYWTMAWASFLGGSLGDSAVVRRAIQATPLTYVDAEDPPFLIIHGEMDDMVPIRQSELLAEALQDAGVDVTFVRLPHAGHGFFGPSGESVDVAPEFLEPTLTFFDQHLEVKERAPGASEGLELLREDSL